MKEIIEKVRVENKLKIAKDKAALLAEWQQAGSSEATSEIKGRKRWEEKSRKCIVKESSTDVVQLASTRANCLKETGSFGGEGSKWSK